MPKKFTGTNSKVAAANEKKAAVKAEKDAKTQRVKDQQEASSWREGAKDDSKQKEADAKKAEKDQRRREAQLQLEAEAKEIARSQAAKTAPPKLAPKKKAPATTAAITSSESAPPPVAVATESYEPIESFAAHNIDDALDLIDAIAISDDTSSQPSASTGVSRHAAVAPLIDRHPERRAKAAFHVYQERE
ncbi:hypothetical protein IWW38_003180, partial [Coemansia aciculifera]